MAFFDFCKFREVRKTLPESKKRGKRCENLHEGDGTGKGKVLGVKEIEREGGREVISCPQLVCFVCVLVA